MSKPTITVIVPVYKAMATLDRCVESIVSQQTEEPIACILVDDGSPDDSGKMCDVWAARDPRVTVIHQEDRGVSGARNAGLRAATGEYIVFLDSDDALRPGALAAALAAQVGTLASKTEGFAVLDTAVEEPMKAAIRAAGADGDSVGGILETAILGLPAGLGEPYFDSVESLLAQSYTDFELILVENGSSDDSRERCARYAAEHPGRIRTLTLDEASVSAARNAGIDNARGRFITFMDADDWAEKEFLAEFFRDPAPGPGTIVMQGILLDFSEAEPPGPNEAFFSYDDGALAIGDDPSAAVGQRFLQDGCSVCKLYHTETLRRLGIRFIEHLCSREDHLFFFTCISRMQSVVWRSGVYMHYMRRGRNTLSTRPMPACELVEAAERLDRFIPQLAERFGITDKTYLFALRQNLVRDTLLRAANNIRFGDRRSVLGAIAARPELFGAETYTPRWHPLLKRPLLDRILKGRECHTLLYLRIALRRSSLRLRGRFNA